MRGLLVLGLCAALVVQTGCGGMFAAKGRPEATDPKVAKRAQYLAPAKERREAGDLKGALALWVKAFEGKTRSSMQVLMADVDYFAEWKELAAALDRELEVHLGARDIEAADRVASMPSALAYLVGPGAESEWVARAFDRIKSRGADRGDAIREAEAKGLDALAWCLYAGAGDKVRRDGARKRFEAKYPRPTFHIDAPPELAEAAKLLARDLAPMRPDPRSKRRIELRFEDLKDGYAAHETDGASDFTLYSRPVPTAHSDANPAERDAMMAAWVPLERHYATHGGCHEPTGGVSKERCRAEAEKLRRPFDRALQELEAKIQSFHGRGHPAVDWQEVTVKRSAGPSTEVVHTYRGLLVVKVAGEEKKWKIGIRANSSAEAEAQLQKEAARLARGQVEAGLENLATSLPAPESVPAGPGREDLRIAAVLLTPRPHGPQWWVASERCGLGLKDYDGLVRAMYE